MWSLYGEMIKNSKNFSRKHIGVSPENPKWVPLTGGEILAIIGGLFFSGMLFTMFYLDHDTLVTPIDLIISLIPIGAVYLGIWEENYCTDQKSYDKKMIERGLKPGNPFIDENGELKSEYK